MDKISLTVLTGEFSIHKLHPSTKIPDTIHESKFYQICRTDEELSIVCETRLSIRSDHEEKGWACIQVDGPLDFGLTGILAGISQVLAESNISIFAISTYDTDYILVKHHSLDHAVRAFKANGYAVRTEAATKSDQPPD
ncbi:MAG: ACT domain-containing protein [Thermodesulfobacteriota bacterium]|nr:ACT domain-containing protein [Thermodesulfobacteriota bacterium]